MFLSYPDYQWNEKQEKRLRSELYKVLLPVVGNTHLMEATNSLLKLQRV